MKTSEIKTTVFYAFTFLDAMNEVSRYFDAMDLNHKKVLNQVCSYDPKCKMWVATLNEIV